MCLLLTALNLLTGFITEDEEILNVMCLLLTVLNLLTGFIPEDEEILSKYIKDVNVHFANKVVSSSSCSSVSLIFDPRHHRPTIYIIVVLIIIT